MIDLVFSKFYRCVFGAASSVGYGASGGIFFWYCNDLFIVRCPLLPSEWVRSSLTRRLRWFILVKAVKLMWFLLVGTTEGLFLIQGLVHDGLQIICS